MGVPLAMPLALFQPGLLYMATSSRNDGVVSSDSSYLPAVGESAADAS